MHISNFMVEKSALSEIWEISFAGGKLFPLYLKPFKNARPFSTDFQLQQNMNKLNENQTVSAL